MPVFAELLVLNRINNQQDKPVTVVVKNTFSHPNTFSISVNAYENKTLPWVTVWLGDDGEDDPSTGWHYDADKGNLSVNNKEYTYSWTDSLGIAPWFTAKFANQAPFDTNVQVIQGKAMDSYGY